jgi:uncharacterized membrane protein
MTIFALTHLLARSVVQAASEPTLAADTFTRIYTLVSPYNEFILVLFVLWLFARRGRPRQGDFNKQAQEVLEEKYRKGEISRKTYEKFRQDVSLRMRR